MFLFAASTVLERYLVGDVDRRLAETISRVDDPFGSDTPRHDTTQPPAFIATRQPPGTFGAVFSEGAVISAGLYSEDGNEEQLSMVDLLRLSRLREQGPANINLSSGEYRFQVQALPNENATFVLGYSLDATTGTVGALRTFGFGLITLIGAVSFYPIYAITRYTLKPLDLISEHARSVSSEMLTKNTPISSIPRPGRRAPVEVQVLGDALNSMTEKVSVSLAEKDRRAGQLSRFIRDASHELRTPLTIVNGYAEMADRFAQNDERLKPLLATVRSGTERLSEIVAGMLMVARSEAGEDFRYGTTDLASLVRERFSAIADEDTAHRWSLDIGNGYSSVWGDPVRLGGAIDVLLTNACRYSGEGSRISVTLHTAGDQIRLTVMDTGPGIDVAVAADIFEPFVSGSAGRDKASSGIGLGLTIARAIINAHGGSIDHERERNVTQFHVLLPLFSRGEDVVTAVP